MSRCCLINFLRYIHVCARLLFICFPRSIDVLLDLISHSHIPRSLSLSLTPTLNTTRKDICWTQARVASYGFFPRCVKSIIRKPVDMETRNEETDIRGIYNYTSWSHIKGRKLIMAVFNKNNAIIVWTIVDEKWFEYTIEVIGNGVDIVSGKSTVFK